MQSKFADQVAFDAKPLREGEGWYIVAAYPAACRSTFLAFTPKPKLKNGWAAKGARLGSGLGVTQTGTAARSCSLELDLDGSPTHTSSMRHFAPDAASSSLSSSLGQMFSPIAVSSL